MKQEEEIFPVTPSAAEQSGGRLGASGKIHSVLKPRHKGNTNEAEVLREGGGGWRKWFTYGFESYVVASLIKVDLQHTPLLFFYAPLSFTFLVKPHHDDNNPLC